MQALYEAVFVMSDLDHPFRIFTRVGHIAVDPAGSSLHDVVKMSSVLVVEIDENAPDLYNLFATQVRIFLILRCILFIYYVVFITIG